MSKNELSDHNDMNKPTILIIDNEPDVLASLSSLLGNNYNVLTALNGKEGLSLIYSNQLSLILLDLNMPEMNGIQFLQFVRNARRDTDVMVITGNSCHDWAKQCADLNVQGYIEKPFDVEMLLKRINRLLPVERFDMLQAIWGDEYEAKIASVSVAVKNALKYIQDNYQREITRDKIASHLDVSPNHLSRQFHKECGIHLKDYINMLKVCKCKECLMDLDKNGADIAKMAGISDINYLYRLFKKYTGLTTQEFRKRHIK